MRAGRPPDPGTAERRAGDARADRQPDVHPVTHGDNVAYPSTLADPARLQGQGGRQPPVDRQEVQDVGQKHAFWNLAKYKSLDPESPKYDPNRIEIGWLLTITPGVKQEDGGPPSEASPTPEPSVSLGPALIPPADGSGLLVTHGSRASNAVSLTFDLGGPPERALAIVQWLVDQRVEATFFTSGQLAQSDPTAKSALAIVAAHPDLFTVGDGTWSGSDMTGLTPSAVADQLGKAEAVIAATVGSTTRPVYRPPEGAQNATVRSAAAGAGFPYAVLWDVDADDAVPETGGGATAEDMVIKISARIQGGSIVRLHLGGPYTLDALPGIVGAIHDAGLHPVTLSRLLGL